MSFIRHAQGVIHAITPNQGNRNVLKNAHYVRRMVTGADLALALGYNYDFKQYPFNGDLMIAGPYIEPQGLTHSQLTTAVVLSATQFGAL